MSFEIIAGHAGTCPICCRFIAKNRSSIVALPVALPPSPEHCYYGRGWFVGGVEGHTRPRRWVHADCQPELTYDELEALAEDWRCELKAKKRQADIDAGRCRRRKSQRSKAAS